MSENELDLNEVNNESNEKRDELNKQIEHIKKLCELNNVLEAPTGRFFKRCPECKSKLKRASFKEHVIHNVFTEYKHFICTKCDYEYAKCT